MSLKKTLPLAAMALAMVGATLAGCTDNGDTGGGSGAAEQINFMVYQPSDQDDQRALQDLIAEFTEETGIQVRLNAVPKDNYDSTFKSAISRGSYKPDLAYMDQPLIATYASDGSISAIDDLLPETIDLDAFNESALATNRYEGKLYGLPLNLTASVLFYNRALVSDEEAPETWAEWKAIETPADVALFDGIGSGGYAGWYFQAFIENCGGKLYDESTGKVAFNSEQGKEAAQFLKDIYRNETDDTIRSSTNAFINGDIMFKIGSSYDIDNMRKQNPNLDVGAILMPSKTGEHHYSVMGGENLVIPTCSTKRESAMKLMEFLMEKENMELLAEFTGNFPSITEYQVTKDPVKQVVIDQFDELLMRPIVPGWMSVNDLYLGQAVTDILDHEEQRDISDALSWAEEASNRTLEK